MTTTRPATHVLRTAYQKSVAEYWNSERAPVNLRLGDVDGLYHHHYGIGDHDPSVLDPPEDTRDDLIIREMHRLESAQAAQRGVADHVTFHYRNMLDTGFEPRTMRGIWTDETTMYVDLFQLFGEFARLLDYGGRYVCITGCYNDVTGGRSRAGSQIDQHYVCNIHPRSAYFKALTANDLIPINVIDLTAQTIPYWELRTRSSVATGIEDAFLTAYREGSLHYLLIAADRINP